MRKPAQVHDTGNNRATKRKEDIDWKTWWPFTLATGDAYKQLNRRQRPNPATPMTHEEAPL